MSGTLRSIVYLEELVQALPAEERERFQRIFQVAPVLAGRALVGMEYYPDAQTALDAALERLGPRACVIALPEAGSVLP